MSDFGAKIDNSTKVRHWQFLSSSQTSWLGAFKADGKTKIIKDKIRNCKNWAFIWSTKVLGSPKHTLKLIMYCMVDKIAKRLLEDQNLTGRTSSWGLLVRKSSLLSKFVFLFLEHWNVNYFTQEVSWKFIVNIVAANKGLLSSYSANAFLGSWARPYWLLLLFLYLKRLLKSSQKFLVCWDSWQDLNPSNSN